MKKIDSPSETLRKKMGLKRRDNLKTFLTDRIGNIGELRPYLPLWSSVPIKEGVLRIEVVEHDATSLNVEKIPKGTDGRALQ